MSFILSLLLLVAEPERPSPIWAAHDCLQLARTDPEAWEIVMILERLDKAFTRASPGGDHNFHIETDDMELAERLKIAYQAYQDLKKAFAPNPKKL